MKIRDNGTYSIDGTLEMVELLQCWMSDNIEKIFERDIEYRIPLTMPFDQHF